MLGRKGKLLCGSSPRVRGTVRSTAQILSPCRFIPACAGNRSLQPILTRLPSVHPRVCGEQGTDLISHSCFPGSSPRVRGTDMLPFDIAQYWRFIPACAGNSRDDSRTSRVTTVHPRVCGEQQRAQARAQELLGSSPRVRGTVDRSAYRAIVRRFIPACAGNRSGTVPSLHRTPVHPRVCGEQTTVHDQNIERGGSSPRVRGTVPRPHPSAPRRRFIPACAGNRFL